MDNLSIKLYKIQNQGLRYSERSFQWLGFGGKYGPKTPKFSIFEHAWRQSFASFRLDEEARFYDKVAVTRLSKNFDQETLLVEPVMVGGN